MREIGEGWEAKRAGRGSCPPWSRRLAGGMLASLAVCAWAAAAELSWPPALPGGAEVVTDRTDRFLMAPPTIVADIAVAATPPTIDFLYYPGQDYPGNPWSNWGDALAVEGACYSAIGDHKAPEGNAFLYEYDVASRRLRRLVDVKKVLGLPPGHYTPGKIHSRIDRGTDGWLYFSTHRGSTRVTTAAYHYSGDWILRHHPARGATEIVARGPVPDCCLPTSVLDPERMIFYGGTAAGDYRDTRVQFFAFDLGARRVVYAGPNGPYRAVLFARSTGRVYYASRDGDPLSRYDPAAPSAPTAIAARLGLRAASGETPQGIVFTVGGDGTLWSFDARTEEADELGTAAVGTQTYTTSLDADPSGRFLYYVPGAHGGSERDGSPVVQFDLRRRTKKVIAFLSPSYAERYGYTPLGTFGTALSPDGSTLYVAWNGNRGGPDARERLAFDTCAFTAIHIPASERAVAATEADPLRFVEAGDVWGLRTLLAGMMSHAAAAGDVDGDGDLDLYVGAFADRPELDGRLRRPQPSAGRVLFAKAY